MSRPTFLAGLALILAGIAIVGFVYLSQDEETSRVVTGLPAPSVDEAAPPPPTAEAVSNSPVSKIEIPSLGLQAPVVSLGVLAGGVMESPHTPTDVGWYRFSAQPGVNGNAVFSGHVDYVNYGPAVFYRLRELKNGDTVRVTLEDGTSYAYQVVSSEIYDAETAPVQEIVGPTPNQMLTLITCTGVFDRNVLQYDKRLVVRAERSTALAR